MESRRPLKPLFWMGSSRKDLKSFPAEVQDEMGYALRDARFGGARITAKGAEGVRRRGVLEVVEDFDRSTYRAVYTVRFEGVVYVLHAFQKMSKHGIATAADGDEPDSRAAEGGGAALQGVEVEAWRRSAVRYRWRRVAATSSPISG